MPIIAALLGLCGCVVAFPEHAVVVLIMTSPTVSLAFELDRWLHKRRRSRNAIPKAIVHK